MHKFNIFQINTEINFNIRMHKTHGSTVRADFIEQELNSYEYFCERTGKADQRIACHGFYGFQ